MFKIAGTGTRKLITDLVQMEKVICQISDTLRAAKAARGEIIVISGMAEGFDEALARGAIKAGVPFHAYIPHPTYGQYYWGKNSLTGRNRNQEFDSLKGQAAYVVVVANSLYLNGLHVNYHRNIAMVDACDILWAYRPTSGITTGTKHCVDYAISVGRRIYYVDQ